MYKIRTFPEHNYKSIFVNGKSIRIAIDHTKPITELSYPEFYDVKITDKCNGKCSYCYMDSKPEDENVDELERKINSFFGAMTSNQRPFQVAIGGGEPTESHEFIDALKAFHNLDIVPNYTTNGMFVLKDKETVDGIIDATKKYCGGVAVSCHDHLDSTWRLASRLFISHGVKLNFHIIISDAKSSDRFRRIYDEWNGSVEYFVLLPYGSQGRADKKEVDWEYLVSVMPTDTHNIAFGANFHKNLTESPGLFNVSLYEPESMSKFLDLKDMTLYPSSFNLTPITDNGLSTNCI